MKMTGRQRTSLLAALVVLTLLLWRARPARVSLAHVTAVAPGSSPLAHVSLVYGGGLRPASVIVEVIGDEHVLGSTTVAGERQLLEIALAGDATSYRVAVTTAHRWPWGVMTRTV